MQKSYEYHSVTLSVKMRHAGDQFAKKTWQFFRVWSWFWYKILPEIIWKKGWSIFFKLAFEYQELRTHTTTQTFLKTNLWHGPPMNHETPWQLKKKNDPKIASKRVSTATEKVPRLISDRLRLWSCALWGSDLLDHVSFLSRKVWLSWLFFGCPKKGGCLKTKKKQFQMLII